MRARAFSGARPAECADPEPAAAATPAARSARNRVRSKERARHSRTVCCAHAGGPVLGASAAAGADADRAVARSRAVRIAREPRGWNRAALSCP
jgi:hypothetical protein